MEPKFFSDNVDDIKKGYMQTNGDFTCMICGQVFKGGFIYPHGENLLDSERAAEAHVLDSHGNMFEYLINLDKQFTDLTEQQRNIISYFYAGLTDKEISRELGGVTAANIRNFRYLFKKKEKQARVFLAITELLKEKGKTPAKKPSDIDNEKILRESIINKYFEFQILEEGLPKKVSERKIVLEEISSYLDFNYPYSEKEINNKLKKFTDDYVMLRRELVDFGFLEREDDGSVYTKKGTLSKERKKELAEAYKNIQKTAGCYQLRNKINGKIFIGTNRELDAKKRSLFLSLNTGSVPFRELQKDFTEYGEENFEFEILEVLDTKDIKPEYIADNLKRMEEKWKEKLKPYGDKGYNPRPISKK